MLKEDKFEEAFKSLKGNKAPGHYDLDYHVCVSTHKKATAKDFQ